MPILLRPLPDGMLPGQWVLCVRLLSKGLGTTSCNQPFRLPFSWPHEDHPRLRFRHGRTLASV